VKKTVVARYHELPAGGWEIVISDRRTLVSVLGEQLMGCFCAAFIQADRLNALSSFVLLSDEHHGQDSRAHERNLHAMLWFNAGVLLEFRRAVQDLDRELQAKGINPSTLSGWRVLRQVRDWKQGQLLWRLRNKIGFHADQKEIRKGLRALLPEREPWVMVRGDDARVATSYVPFGLQPLMRGLAITKREMRGFIRQAAKRQLEVPPAVQNVFMATLRRKRLSVAR
jgi:hypothetical protein